MPQYARTGDLALDTDPEQEDDGPMTTTPAELRKMADAAEWRASKLEALNAASGVDRDRIEAELFYARGQASAFRQAAYYVEMTEREG